MTVFKKRAIKFHDFLTKIGHSCDGLEDPEFFELGGCANKTT